MTKEELLKSLDNIIEAAKVQIETAINSEILNSNLEELITAVKIKTIVDIDTAKKELLSELRSIGYLEEL